MAERKPWNLEIEKMERILKKRYPELEVIKILNFFKVLIEIKGGLDKN